MPFTLTDRSVERLSNLRHSLFSVLRMIVGAYFLAKATGLMLVPGRVTLLHAVFADATAVTLTSSFLIAGGLTLLLGIAVRPVIAGLGFYALGTAGLGLTTGVESVTAHIVQTVLLLGAMTVVAIGHPMQTFRLMEFIRVQRTLRRKLPTMPDLPHMRQHGRKDIDLTATRPDDLTADEQDEWGDDDAGNLFNELWQETSQPRLVRVA